MAPPPPGHWPSAGGPSVSEPPGLTFLLCIPIFYLLDMNSCIRLSPIVQISSLLNFCYDILILIVAGQASTSAMDLRQNFCSIPNPIILESIPSFASSPLRLPSRPLPGLWVGGSGSGSGPSGLGIFLIFTHAHAYCFNFNLHV